MALFEKFGEFDSVEEMNMTAEGLKEEGDLENLKDRNYVDKDSDIKSKIIVCVMEKQGTGLRTQIAR